MALQQGDEISPIDDLIGIKIRAARKTFKMTQSDLGEKLGLSFQQIQKYESAQNKISASKLYHISKILNLPISYFFKISDEDKAGIGFSDGDQEDFNYQDANPAEHELKLLRHLSGVPDDKKHSVVDMFGQMVDMSR